MFVEGNPSWKTDSVSNFSYWSSLNVSGFYSWYISLSLSNARPSKCSLKNALATMFICNMSHGRFLTSLCCQNSKMASAEQFSITPYCFEPEHSSNEESSNRATKMNQVIGTKNASGIWALWSDANAKIALQRRLTTRGSVYVVGKHLKHQPSPIQWNASFSMMILKQFVQWEPC